MGKLKIAAKPTGSKRTASSSPITKSCSYTTCPSSTCPYCHPSSHCTFILYFIEGVSQDDDPSKYAILVGD